MFPLKSGSRSRYPIGYASNQKRYTLLRTLKQLALASMMACLPFGVAEAAAKPDFRIAVKTMRLVGLNTETSTTENGVTTKEVEESTAAETFPENLELAAFLDNWAIYTYPAQSSAALLIGYSGWSGFEIGPMLSLRYNKRSVKTDGTTTSSSEGSSLPGSVDRNAVNLGAYVYYGQPLGTTASWVVEMTLSSWYGLRSGSQTTTVTGPSGAGTGATTLKSKLDGTSVSVAFEAVLAVALADKFEYAPGLGVTWTTESTEGTRQTGASYDSDATTLAWEFSLAKFRYTF